MQVDATTIILAIIYFALILAVGFFAGKKTKGLGDFMIGGQRLGVWVTSFGIMAAVMSGWTWIGNPGSAYATGYSSVVKFYAFTALGMVIGYFVLAKPVRIISSRAKCYTLPDILAARWNNNKTIRLLSSVIILIGCLTYLVSQWSSMGIVMQSVLGVSYPVGVIVGAIIISVYVVAGGMLASMWTNFVQMMIMFVVAIVLIVKSINMLGGFTEMNLAAAAINPELVQPWTSDAPMSVSAVLTYGIPIIALSYAGQPSVNTKFMMIRDSKTLRWAPTISVVAMVVGLLPIILGIAGTVMVNQGIIAAPEKADLILTSIIRGVFSPTLVALIMVAVMAAVMSTAETYLFSSASSVVRDLCSQYFKLNIDEKKILKWTRICMLFVAVLTVVLALEPPAMISQVGAQAFGAFCAGFGPVMYVGMRWKRVNAKAAVGGMVTGLLFGGVLPIIDSAVFGGTLFAGVSIAGVGAIASFVVVIVLTLSTKKEYSAIFENALSAKRDGSARS